MLLRPVDGVGNPTGVRASALSESCDATAGSDERPMRNIEDAVAHREAPDSTIRSPSLDSPPTAPSDPHQPAPTHTPRAPHSLTTTHSQPSGQPKQSHTRAAYPTPLPAPPPPPPTLSYPVVPLRLTPCSPHHTFSTLPTRVSIPPGASPESEASAVSDAINVRLPCVISGANIGPCTELWTASYL